MTKQEKIIISTYTGVLMCNFDDVHEYIQKKLGRPVFSHELADKDIQKEIKEKSKEEFLEICNREEPEQKWIPCSERLPETYGAYLVQDVCGTIFVDYWRGYWLAKTTMVAWMPLPEPYRGGDA